MSANFLRQLEQLTLVKTDAESKKVYGQDWTRRYLPRPLAIAFPQNRGEVQNLLKFCGEKKIAVVPSGGRTGLAAGAVAAQGELVLSLERLRRLEPVDALSGTLRVEAGVTNQEVQEAAAPFQLWWPVDLASKGSAQIGGNLATNAGGLRVIRFGHTRQWVQSLELCLLSGEVLELSGPLEKNNTGYDLRQLVIGSEGTLGVITAATLKLTRRLGAREAALVGLSDLSAALALQTHLRSCDLDLLALEFFSRPCVEAVCAHRSWPEPLNSRAEAYLLIEASAGKLLPALTAAQAQGLLRGEDLRWADTEASLRALWGYRESITESLGARAPGRVYKNDLALPLANLAAFVRDLKELAPAIYPRGDVFIFGHLGDGNLHLNVLPKDEGQSAQEFYADCEKANDPLFALVQSHRGSIAAEHGIGLLKKSYLSYSRSPGEIRLFRELKKAFDPQGLLNPGKIFD